MTKEIDTEEVNALGAEIEAALYKEFGPLLFGKALYAALGYRSGDAFRQALSRKTVPIETFEIEKRRGRFVLSKDVAIWLAHQRINIKEK